MGIDLIGCARQPIEVCGFSPSPVSQYLSWYFRRKRMKFMSRVHPSYIFPHSPSLSLLSPLSVQLAILHSLVLSVNRCPPPITVRLYTSQRSSSLGAHLNKPIDLSF